MPFILRRLEATDIPLLRQLNALFGRAFAEPATFADDPPSDGYLRDMLTKEHIAVVVALKGETVVGGLVAYALGKFKKERREYYIYDLLPVLAPFEFGFGRIFVGKRSSADLARALVSRHDDTGAGSLQLGKLEGGRHRAIAE